MPYTYDFPHPAVTTDVVIFSLRGAEESPLAEQSLSVLLIKRGAKPFKGAWALPGGFLRMDEHIDDCALRELEEETGVKGAELIQLGAFGAPKRDPRERVVSIAYYALIPSELLVLRPDTDAADAKWFSIDELPKLAFDHDEIIATALASLRSELRDGYLATQFLEPEFTLTDAQVVFEKVEGDSLDKRNFRKWISAAWELEETGDTRTDGRHRPAKLYRLVK